MRRIKFVASALALACISPPPALSSFPARSGAVWTEDCCGEPIVDTKPEYPQSALQRAGDGWVIVSGLLDERGWVTDPIVLAADPEGVFDQAALKAFRGWRYAAHSDPGIRREVRAVLSFRRPRTAPSVPIGGPIGGGTSGGGPGY